MKIRKKKGLIDLIFSGVSGVTLAPFGIYLSKRHLTNAKTIRHEKIHWKQQIEMLIFPFYVWYLVEWLIRLITNKGNAYRAISFEQEAYRNESNLNYLNNRKHFAFLRYL
ncbi:MAG: hypothetical protein AB2L20_14915 [Mangrovibacterium sp.]